MVQNTNQLSHQSPAIGACTLIILLVCAIVLSSWNLLNSVFSWYTSSSSTAFWWRAIYASMEVGVIFGILSMVVALAVAVPAIVVVWSSILVLLSFVGKPRVVVVVEGKKLTAEMSRAVGMVLIKEGNLVAAVCAVVGYVLFVRYGREHGL